MYSKLDDMNTNYDPHVHDQHIDTKITKVAKIVAIIIGVCALIAIVIVVYYLALFRVGMDNMRVW